MRKTLLKLLVCLLVACGLCFITVSCSKNNNKSAELKSVAIDPTSSISIVDNEVDLSDVNLLVTSSDGKVRSVPLTKDMIVTPLSELSDGDNTIEITYDGITTTLTVKVIGINGADGAVGNGIATIVKTSSVGLVDTYTITFTNGTTTTFTITNGADGADGADGEGGKSAYDIYCDAYSDYTKSESEWLDDLINGRLGTEEKIFHTVTLNDNGNITTQLVENGGKIVEPVTEIYDDCFLDGWLCNDEKWSFIGYSVTQDITLNANWIPNLDVVFSVDEFDEEYAIIKKFNNKNLTSFTIPEFIDGRPVAEIKSYAFESCPNLQSITIPDSVYEIDNKIFKNCDNLQKITMPYCNSSYFEDFFDNYDIPLTLTDVVLNYCDYINDYAFSNCYSLQSITLPDSIHSIKENAFLGCENLSDVYYTGDLESWLIIQSFHSGLLLSAENLYIDNSRVENLVIPSDLSNINNTFEGYKGLKTVTFPEGFNRIINFAFAFCGNLTSVIIPDSVEYIGNSAFFGCENLSDVYYTGDLESWFQIENQSSNILQNAEHFYINGTLLENLVFPNNFTYVNNSFNGYLGLKTITIPKSVETIEPFAFADCDNLTSVNFEYLHGWNTINFLTNEKSAVNVSDATNIVALFLAGNGFSNETPDKNQHYCDNPSYSWNSDFSQCTASAVCSQDGCNVPFSETADSTSVVVHSKDCTSDELSSFTASFENDAFSSQVKENIKTADMLGHSLDSSVYYHDISQHWFKCQICSENLNIESHSYGEWQVFNPATCYVEGNNFQTCVCGYKNFVNTPLIPHTMTTPSYSWNFDYSQCVASVKCSTVGCSYNVTETSTTSAQIVQVNSCTAVQLSTFTASFVKDAFSSQVKENIKTADMLEHNFDTSHFFYDETNHWFECSVCNEKTDIVPHSFDENAHDDTNHWIECECGAISNQVTHVFGDWLFDATKHWHLCDCGQISDEALHSYDDWVIESTETHTTTGLKHAYCALCNRLETVIVPVIPHSFSTEWISNETGHWNVCSCGEKTTVVAHDFDDDNTCTICGFVLIHYSEGLLFALDEASNTYSVTGIGSCSDSILTIPAKYNGANVVKIAENAFKGNSTISSVVIPNTVTEIGSFSFSQCVFDSIIIPDSVIKIQSNAFRECKNLKSIVLGKNLNYIGNYSFFDCPFLFEVYNLSNLVLSLDDNYNSSFVNYYASAIYTSLSAPKAFSTDANGFVTCSDETKNVLVHYIGSNSNVLIPNGITKIGASAFYNNTSLTNVSIPSSVTSIGDHAFFGCSNLSNIVLPDNLTTIYSYAFSSSGLTSIVIPNSVTSIKSSIFMNCASISAVTFSNQMSKIPENMFSNCISLTSITIPDFITTIGTSAFSQCSNLKNVVLSENLEKIETLAFWYCTSLQSITIPYYVTEIADRAFMVSTISSVTFENTAGWSVKYANNSPITVDVTDASVNASRFKNQYYNYDWIRTE